MNDTTSTGLFSPKGQKKSDRTNLQALFAACCLGASFLFTGCGDLKAIPKDKKVHSAPKSPDEVGVTVLGVSETQMAELLERQPDLSVRMLNSTLFEVFGTSPTSLRNEFPNEEVLIEKNQFVELQNNTLKNGELVFTQTAGQNPFISVLEMNLNISIIGPARAYLEKCVASKMSAPHATIASMPIKNPRYKVPTLEVGQSITLSSESSTSQLPDKSLSALWVVTTPDDSNLPTRFEQSKKLQYSPDATGVYMSVVVVKDSQSVCNLAVLPFVVTANDPYAPQQVIPEEKGNTLSTKIFWHLFQSNSFQARSLANGEGRVVAVIDSGVNYNHAALAANILVNKAEIPNNNIDDDKNGFVDDYVGYDFMNDDGSPFDDAGHGSHVAGIAASPIFGAARKAKILPIKMGSELGADMASAAAGIIYAVNRGANVLNLSFGSNTDSDVLRKAINYAEKKGCLVVVAAGNETSNNDVEAAFPANFENANLISVGATDKNEALTPYSNFGMKVHVSAPGGTGDNPIVSSYKKTPKDAVPLIGLAGTSMASPLVAGIAAQVWSVNPKLTALELKDILLKSSRTKEALKSKVKTGAIVDALAATNKALLTKKPDSIPPLAQARPESNQNP